MPQSSTLSMGMNVQKDSRSSWMPGIFGSHVVREGPSFFQAMAQEGLQGGKGGKHEVAQPQPIHAPSPDYSQTRKRSS